MPEAGRYRARIVIERATEARDTFGEADPTWATFATRWAAILPQSGREFTAAKALYPELTHLVETRWVAGVTPKMRVRYGTRRFDIVAVMNQEERSVEMTLACRELVA